MAQVEQENGLTADQHVAAMLEFWSAMPSHLEMLANRDPIEAEEFLGDLRVFEDNLRLVREEVTDQPCLSRLDALRDRYMGEVQDALES